MSIVSRAEAYPVAATLIGRDLTSDEAVWLSLRSRMSGLYVLGKQGRGKTNFLLSLIVQDLYAGHGLCVLDPHGDLTTDVLACIPAHREADVILLDLHDTAHPFAFDLFAGVDPRDPGSLAMGEERIVGVFKKVWGDVSWGPRLEDLLANAVHVLLLNPGTTLADLPRLLTDAAERERLLQAVSSPIVHDYFAAEYAPLTSKGQAAVYGPLLNKVRAFLRHPLLGRIVAQSGTTVDVRAVLAERKVLLVRLDARLREATSLLGTALVLRLFEAALARQDVPTQRRPPFCLYADEFQLFATPTFADFLQQARKYAVATTLAHQLRSQLPAELRDAVKGAVNVVTFQPLTDDAREMTREYVSAPAALPDDLFHWAVNHADPVIRQAAAEVLRSIPYVTVRYDDEGPDLSLREKLAFFARRLRQAVREGSSRAGPFPPSFWYGTYDLEQGAYARLAAGFAVLRDRLLATRRIDADDLADLPVGVAAAKLERADGRMRQGLLRVPRAIAPDHSFIVKTLLDHPGPLPTAWPADLPPALVVAGLRARRIRERTRAVPTREPAVAPELAMPTKRPVAGKAATGDAPPGTPPLPSASCGARRLPVQAEVDID
jgi:hypothetical protein